MSIRDRLILLLADGQFHSGAGLARALGVSRSAVWKQAHQLCGLGLDLEVARRQGYRLKTRLDLLDRQAIARALDPASGDSCEGLDVCCVVESTNSILSEQPRPSPGLWKAAIAEYQTGGRGRRGRRWLSPFGCGLCMSFAWSFAIAPRDLSALSLAAGMASIRVLEAAGAAGLALKWPNDIVADGAKLGGILVDVDGDSRGPLRAIIGVGINIRAPESLADQVASEGGLPPAAIDKLISGKMIDRNRLAADLLGSLRQMALEFARDGFGPLASRWSQYDFLLGKRLIVANGASQIRGVGRGLGADGALLVEQDGTIATVFSGDVSVRAVPT